MIKSTQIKIILIIVILAIIMFGTYGLYSILKLEEIKNIITDNDVLLQQILNQKIMLTILLISFLLISMIIIWFTKKIVDKPILKLIQSAKQIDHKFSENAKSDIDELTNAFDAVNTGLKENFNEVIRQKKTNGNNFALYE